MVGLDRAEESPARPLVNVGSSTGVCGKHNKAWLKGGCSSSFATTSKCSSSRLNSLSPTPRDGQLTSVAPYRFTSGLQLALNVNHGNTEVAKDVAFYADQLNDVGDAILALAKNISESVELIAKSLSTEKSEDAAKDLTRVSFLRLAFPSGLAKWIFTAAQRSALEVFGTSLLKIAANSPPVKEGGRTQKERQKLSPAAHAIADGFERLLGGQKENSRMSYGRIPPHHRG
ncbi:unnamed protein product [Cyclocybe aegerita]|uniref:Uncharacterized protein n=1 Tax=Cyclocybe aegerita TaxID=1973307 RepID=A0A8S0WR49_CYCAE|nr:unnamed protein product [Cyclocybe aegerita]